MRNKFVVGWAAFLLLVSGVTVFAQSNSAIIQGIVRDPSSAVISGAEVVATNVATGVKYRGFTNSTGFFRLPAIEKGTYTLEVAAQGFRPAKVQNISVLSNDTRDLEIPLAVGGGSTEVQVSAQAPMTELSTSEVSATIEPKKMMDLPLNGRDFTRLALLTPGVVATYSNLSSLTFNGMNSETSNNNFLLDGTDATNIENNRPSAAAERGPRLQTGSIEGLEEFKVSEGTYSAEFGRAAGSVVQITSKSGTNEFHGDLFWFVRNQMFDAANFFDPQPLPFHLNQFGGTIGGPIVKNKTFFFANYEGSRQRIGITGVGTVPLPSALVGVDPVLQPLIDTFPPYTSTINATTGRVQLTGSSITDENAFAVKLDHNFSEKDRVAVRYSWSRGHVGGPAFALYSLYLGTDQVQQSNFTSQFVNVSHTHVFSNSLLNSLRFGVNLKDYDINNGGTGDFPQVSITGYQMYVGTLSQSKTRSRSFDVAEKLAWVKGRHTFSFGTDFRRPDSSGSNNGLHMVNYGTLSDFLLNHAQYAIVQPDQPDLSFSNWNLGFFAQDDWKVNRRLTLNLGLRYEYNTVVSEAEGRLSNYVGGTGPNLVGGNYSTPGTPLYTPTKGDVAPRIGFAWDLFGSGKTVLRAGYGMFYNLATINTSQTAVSNPPGPGVYFMFPAPVLSIPLPDPTTGIPLAQRPVAVQPDLRDGYTHQYSLTLEQQLGESTVVRLGYMGYGGRHLLRFRNVNYMDPTTFVRPDPRFSNILLYESAGTSNYNALQIWLNRRFAKDFMYGVSYSWSHNIDDIPNGSAPQDPLNMAAERGTSDSDVRHTFAFHFGYTIPFDRWTGRKNRLTEGWQINGIGSIRSGLPLDVKLGYDSYGNLSYNERPDRVPGVAVTGSPSLGSGFINPNAFTDPAPGTYGNAGRNVAVGPSFRQVDLSLFKDTKIRESQVLQFRWEVFNITNTPNYSNFFVGTTLTAGAPGTINPGFGVATQTFGRTIGLGTSRQMQFALKFIF